MTLEASGHRFSPVQIRVEAGTPINVEFVNHGPHLHDVTIDELDFHVSALDGTIVVAGLRPKRGRYAFYCAVGDHRQLGMEGVLVVD